MVCNKAYKCIMIDDVIEMIHVKLQIWLNCIIGEDI